MPRPPISLLLLSSTTTLVLLSTAAAGVADTTCEGFGASSTLRPACEESLGFFRDVPAPHWERKKRNFHRALREQGRRGELPERPQAWYQRNHD